MISLNSKEELTAFEHEFVQAINNGQIFLVYQPIVDRYSKIQGVEILCRWKMKDKIIHPNEFLSQIQSKYAWEQLTYLTLLNAIKNINYYKGKYYFSINIPNCIANDENIISMIVKAKKQLCHAHWINKLVLEFPETINTNLHSDIAKNIIKLQKQGLVIALDDCYSKNSVNFPVRLIQFNQYKLDMSIINDSQYDPYALSLIKSFIYFCKLNKIPCIAEGVDNVEKFNFLKLLGINYFQGYFISPPVNLDQLKTTIQQLNNHNP